MQLENEFQDSFLNLIDEHLKKNNLQELEYDEEGELPRWVFHCFLQSLSEKQFYDIFHKDHIINQFPSRKDLAK